MSKPTIRRQRRWIADLSAIILSLSVLLAARSSLADHYHVPSGSMQPTVEVGDRVVVSKAAYALRVPFTELTLARFDGPARGDVVVLASPDDGVTLLKRVVAVPGDEVEIRRGRITIDDRAQPVVVDSSGPTEQLGGALHPLDLGRGGGPDYGPRILGPDEYLVVGDNRGNSRDGRMFGTVSRDAFRGRVLGVYLSGGRLTWRDL
jgi:signal peptidase I